VEAEGDKGALVVGDEEVRVNLPIVNEGSDRYSFVSEVKTDSSLKVLHELTDRDARGCYLEDDLLMQQCTDCNHEVYSNMVVPESRRKKLLELAHDEFGHLGHIKVAILLRRNFVWPLMNSNVKSYCESCPLCQHYNKHGQRKALMIKRPVISQQFEQIALNLVGSLPKAMGGARFILTVACMATCWPEAIALRSITAKSVAEAAMEIFSIMGLSQQVLTDRGPPFVGSLAKQLSFLLNIEKLHTTAYYPQIKCDVGTLTCHFRSYVREGTCRWFGLGSTTSLYPFCFAPGP